MKSNELFTTQVIPSVKRSTFYLSHDNLLTFELGDLIPALVQECLPSETWRIGAETLVRFQPLVAPVYQRFRVFRNYFFVPSRILWKEWEEFIVKQGVDDTIPHPSIELVASRDYSLYGEGTLFDYIGGVPSHQVEPSVYGPSYLQEHDCDINALPFAAYQKVYYEYFRDQNQIDGTVGPITNCRAAGICESLGLTCTATNATAQATFGWFKINVSRFGALPRLHLERHQWA